MITAKRTAELYALFEQYGKISTDSRSVSEGSVFFALRGASFDGNRFAADALAKGAAIAVVDDPSTAPADDRMFLVEDTLQALQALAQWHRQQLGVPIVAITGTNGKTTTKELAAAVLGRRYNVYATRGNLNNHIGVPLTLLSMTRETGIGIVEMGAAGHGEIALLCHIARPDYGLITNIGLAHLEGFGDAGGVRTGKGELFDFLAASGGQAIVRKDDGTLREMAEERKNLRTVWYDAGFADGFASRLTGDYNRYNIASAVALGRLFEVGETDIRQAIADYEPSNNRSQLFAGAHNRVVVDCYNANPSSMRASIEAFMNNEGLTSDAGTNNAPDENSARNARRERVLILGDMLELGSHTQAEHLRTVQQAVGSGASAIYFVGAEFTAAVGRFTGASEQGAVTKTGGLEVAVGSMHAGRSRNLAIYTYPDVEALRAALTASPLKGKLILLKGSRGIGLEKILGLL